MEYSIGAICRFVCINTRAPRSPSTVSPSFSPLYFPIPFIIFALLVLLPPSGNLVPGPHRRLLSPRATTVRALHLYREKGSALPSLVNSRLIVHAYPRCNARSRQQLVSFEKTEIRTHDNTYSIRG